ncbi:hypothetical protein PM082_024344 [Marasmius tenuissimus]|nr:hypothetical protein PM082_024344 [Marasmius tenuissimus]
MDPRSHLPTIRRPYFGRSGERLLTGRGPTRLHWAVATPTSAYFCSEGKTNFSFVEPLNLADQNSLYQNLATPPITWYFPKMSLFAIQQEEGSIKGTLGLSANKVCGIELAPATGNGTLVGPTVIHIINNKGSSRFGYRGRPLGLPTKYGVAWPQGPHRYHTFADASKSSFKGDDSFLLTRNKAVIPMIEFPQSRSMLIRRRNVKAQLAEKTISLAYSSSLVMSNRESPRVPPTISDSACLRIVTRVCKGGVHCILGFLMVAGPQEIGFAAG